MAKASKAKRLVEKSALRVLDLRDLKVDSSYQRDVVQGHKKIIADFNAEALGIPLVGERDDSSLYIVDGLQRITALKALGKKVVRAEVFRSEGPEHEAKVFKLVNKNRTALKSLQLFHALLTGHDELAWTVRSIAEEAGFTIPRGQQATGRDGDLISKQLRAVNTSMRIAAIKKGPETLKLILTTIGQIWPGDTLRVKDVILNGMASWVYRHGVESIDQQRLVDRLATTTPQKLIYSSSQMVGDQAANMADIIERLYKKRYRSRG